MYSFTESAKPPCGYSRCLPSDLFFFVAFHVPIYSFAQANVASPSLDDPSRDSRQPCCSLGFLQDSFKDTDEQ